MNQALVFTHNLASMKVPGLYISFTACINTRTVSSWRNECLFWHDARHALPHVNLFDFRGKPFQLPTLQDQLIRLQLRPAAAFVFNVPTSSGKPSQKSGGCYSSKGWTNSILIPMILEWGVGRAGVHIFLALAIYIYIIINTGTHVLCRQTNKQTNIQTNEQERCRA